VSNGRGAVVATRLLEKAGPDLYRRNAFRIAGLSTDVGGRVVREHRQRVLPALAVGAPVTVGGTLSQPVPATPDQIRSAFDALGDAQRRIVEELFWLWETPNASCSCVPSLHQDHDAAVQAHARALDRELDGRSMGREGAVCDELWAEAADGWTALLRRTAFWDHIRHRIRALDDRRLDDSTIDALRDNLPRALVTPMVDLAAAADDPARLAAHAARWQVGQHVVEDLLTEAASPLLETVKAATARADAQLGGGHPLDAAADLHRSAVPALTRLEGLAPHERHRSTATARNRVAVLLNNCAMAAMNRPGRATTDEIRPLFDAAHGLVVEPETRQTIEGNRAILDDQEQANRDLAPFGVTVENDGFAVLAERVHHLIKSGRFEEARNILVVLRRYADGPGAALEIDRLLAVLSGTGSAPVAPPRAPGGAADTSSVVRKLFVGALIWFLVFPGLVFYAFGVPWGIVACVVWAFLTYLSILGTIHERRKSRTSGLGRRR